MCSRQLCSREKRFGYQTKRDRFFVRNWLRWKVRLPGCGQHVKCHCYVAFKTVTGIWCLRLVSKLEHQEVIRSYSPIPILAGPMLQNISEYITDNRSVPSRCLVSSPLQVLVAMEVVRGRTIPQHPVNKKAAALLFLLQIERNGSVLKLSQQIGSEHQSLSSIVHSLLHTEKNFYIPQKGCAPTNHTLSQSQNHVWIYYVWQI